MSRPRLLDLFAGAGGAAVGYDRAGFEVTGVDIAPQKNYPFRFIQGGAIEYVRAHGHEYEAIHASPPCQAYSAAQRLPWVRKDHPQLIEPVREALMSCGRPYVIENVVGAPLIRMLFLCGSMFGEAWHRHRWFESSELLLGLDHSQHRSLGRYRPGKVAISYMDGDLEKMGLDWMTRMERRQAIPPMYAEFVGTQLIAALERAA